MTFANRLIPMAAAASILLLSGAALAETKVVVTSKPIHALVASVMVGIGTPELLVDGTASPHSYAMKPSDAQKVHSADVFFRVAEELEPFTAKLVAGLPRFVRVVSLIEAPGLKRLPRREGGAFEVHKEHGHKHAHGHDHDGDADDEHAATDPHVWLDPENAKTMVGHIADVLATLMPQKATTLRANAEAEIGRISAMSDELGRELAPVAGRPFIVYHDAYQYFERRYGLTAAGSVTVSPDLPPSGKRLQELRRKIASSGAVCVFAEPYFSPRVTDVLVEGTNARIGTLDPEGTTLTPGPGLYHTLMRNLARDFKTCLAGT